MERSDLSVQGNALRVKHSPLRIHKIAKKPLSLLRIHGIKIIAYLDDMLLAAPSKPLLEEQVNMTISLIQALGFRVNWDKSLIIPQQILEFLGIEVNSVEMTLRIPQSTIHKIKTQCQKLAHKSTCSAKELSALIGLLSFTKVAIPTAPPILSSSSVRSNIGYTTTQGLQPEGHAFPILPSQPQLVDGRCPEMELQPNCKTGNRSGYSDRRLADRLGCFFPWEDGLRNMVSGREDLPYQFSRIESSLLWREGMAFPGCTCCYKQTTLRQSVTSTSLEAHTHFHYVSCQYNSCSLQCNVR